MVSTGLTTKDKKMVVSKEISDDFTSQRLEKIFGKIKEEIIERFDEKFTAQNQKIVYLKEKIALQEKKKSKI